MDQKRTSAIAGGARNTFGQGGKVLLLTERTDYLDDIASALVSLKLSPFVLHGRLLKITRAMAVTNEVRGRQGTTPLIYAHMNPRRNS